MSTQIKARPINRERPSAHEVLLAGIGAVSLIRKNAGKSWTEAAAIAGRLPEAASILIEGAGERTVATIREVGARGNAFRYEFERLARVFGRGATAATVNVVADVESRLQPLLRKFEDTSILFGIKIARPQSRPATAKRGRKAGKPVAKRAVRKARKAA